MSWLEPRDWGEHALAGGGLPGVFGGLSARLDRGATARRSSRRAGAMLVSVMLAMAASGCGSSAPRAGQIVFEPAGVEPTTSPTPASDPESRPGSAQLSLDACEVRESGLAVRGMVSGTTPIVVVKVSGGSRSLPGLRVGRDYLLDTGRGASGEFSVLLPWAGVDSAFYVEGEGESQAVTMVRCPR